ncbi:MAG: hypothetical protein HZA16_15140 [Nitrospirae bacterium]|nr:hypothetical protein [Nitrospirota bacterium]
MSAVQALETYFLDNRARLLEIASFLDRIDRYKESSAAKDDFRYKSFIKALRLVIECGKDRTQNVQLLFSDLSAGPIENAAGLKAHGAWEGAFREGN